MEPQVQPSALPNSLSDLWKDDVVDEIHARRAELAAKFDFDLDRIFDYYRRREALANRDPDSSAPPER